MNLNPIILVMVFTFIVPILGIYYSKKTKNVFSFYLSIVIFILGIWYLLLRIVEKFLGYNYIYFTFITLAYFMLVFLIVKLIKYLYIVKKGKN